MTDLEDQAALRQEDALLRLAGRAFGILTGIVVFFIGWASAVASWGWLLGLAFGWVPAAIVGAIAGVLAWALAPFVFLAVVMLFIWWVWQFN